MSAQYISVVIPVYNEEEFVVRCLESLAHQSRLPNRIYIIDNNSTDASKSIATQFDTVTVIHERIQGICAATKTGLDKAATHGGLILRCDADCVPPVDWVEKIEKTFKTHDAIAAVTGRGVAYDVGWIQRILIDVFYMRPYFIFTGLALSGIPLFGSNFGIRADVWRTISNKTHLHEHQDIHDDMDISYHLTARVYYDRALVMPISARPFRNFKKMIARYKAGFKSVFIHWPSQAPWKRFKQ